MLLSVSRQLRATNKLCMSDTIFNAMVKIGKTASNYSMCYKRLAVVGEYTDLTGGACVYSCIHVFPLPVGC